MDFSSIYIKALLFAIVLMIPFVSVADDNGFFREREKSSNLREYSIVQQDTVRKNSTPPKKEDPKKKTDARSIQEKIRDSRSSIKQVPRSIPKLKPQRVSEKIRIPKPSIPSKKGGKLPF